MAVEGSMVRSDRAWLGCLIIVAIAAQGRDAVAQSASAEAEALFRQGKDLMAAGKLAEACDAFDLSQKLDPRATTLLNQANCRQRNGQLATAWSLFLEAARQTRTATDAAGKQLHAVAAERVIKLENRLSTLRIDVPPANAIAGLELLRNGEAFDPVAWNKPLPIDGGVYRISARAPHAVEWSIEITVAAESDAKRVEIPRLAPEPDIPVTMPAQAPAPNQVVVESPDARTAWTVRRKVALGVGGGGVVALVIGGVLGASANGKQSDAHALCPSPMACDGAERANELIRSGHRLAIDADIAFGVGAAAVISAGVLWFLGSAESRPRVAIVPSAAPEHLGLTAMGRF
jgi:hypothetical protein